MNKIVVESLEEARRCYAEVCEDMWQGILNALFHREEFEFDEKRLGRFEEAVDDLVTADVIASDEEPSLSEDFKRKIHELIKESERSKEE